MNREETNKVAANTGWLMAQQIYSMVVSLVIGALTARYLGPSNKGLLEYSASLIAIFNAISQVGLNGIIVAELVRSPDKQGRYMGAALALRLASSVVSIFCVMAIVQFMEPDNKLLHTITFLQSLAILFQTHQVFNYYFQAKLLSRYYVWACMLATTIVGGWRVFLLVTGKSVEWFALSNSINALVILLFTGGVFAILMKTRLSLRLEDVRYLLSQSHHYIISGLAAILYLQMDRIMLGKMAGPTQVGYYGAAATVAELWEFVPMAIISSVSPIIYRLKETDAKGYRQKLQWLFAGLTYMGLGVGVVMCLFSNLLIGILYGEAFAPAAPLLRVLIWATCIAIINSVRTIWFVAERKNHYVKYYTLAGVGVNLVFNYLAIPHWGAMGAAVATLMTQAVVLLCCWFSPGAKEVLSIYGGSFATSGELFGFVRQYVVQVWKEKIRHEHS